MSLALSGELSFARVPAVLDEARAALTSGDGPVELDLAQVTRVDSAGVALLLELKRHAARSGRDLRFARPPEQLRKLAHFFGVAGLLALSD